jgi:hypothetical protein
MVESSILPNGECASDGVLDRHRRRQLPSFRISLSSRREGQAGDLNSTWLSISNRLQAMLVIRGTQTSIDWTINLDETLFAFTYRRSGHLLGSFYRL